MAKKNFGRPLNEANTGMNDEANFRNSDIPNEKKYIVVHKFNSPIEIYIGREFLKFEAHTPNPIYPEKYQDGLPESIINHPDFQAAAKNFTVIEKV
jgi:hypothetical protein